MDQANINITIDIEPFSVNKTKAVFNGRLLNTAPFRNWKVAVYEHLLKERLKMKAFAETCTKRHQIYARYSFGKPIEKLYTKGGWINQSGGDAQCYVKTLQDVVFEVLNKYNPCLDDAQVINYTVRTLGIEEWKIGVYLEIRDLRG